MSDLNRIIVALDKPDLESALQLARLFDPSQCRLKVGKELFIAEGPAIVSALHTLGFQVFLDLKLHDIPNTVAAACKSAARLGVWMLTLHASGGKAMMKAAREAIGSPGGHTPLLVGVTVLTSLDEPALGSIGVAGRVDDQVRRLTSLVDESGLDGVVCGANEAEIVKSQFPKLYTVTPGIRLVGDQSADQKRVMAPDAAIRSGADYMVVGRSITASDHPQDTLSKIQKMIVEQLS